MIILNDGSMCGAESIKSDWEVDMKNWIEPVTGMEFMWIPAGKFEMGNPFAVSGEDESPAHEVELDGFWLGRYPVT